MPRFLTALFLMFALVCAEDVRAQQSPANEEQEYAFALGLFKDGHYQLAYQQFTDFQTRFPASNVAVDAEYFAAECQYQMGGLTDAALLFGRFIERHPASKLSDDAAFRRAEVLYRQAKYADAHTAFADVLRTWPEGNLAHEAAYWAGESAFRDGNPPAALRYYTIAYDHYAQGRIRDYALYSVAYVHEKTGRYDEARTVYDSLLATFPTSSLAVAARTRIGACLHLKGQHEDALAWFASLTDSPDAENVAERLYLRGECAYKLGRFADAERHYRDYVGAYPDGAREREVRYSLGWTFVEQKKYSEAIAVFDELGAGSDGVAEAARYRKGMTLRLAGNVGEARMVFEDMLARAPLGEYADNAHFELGMTAFHEGAWTMALERFTDVTRRFPQSDVLADAWNMSGECHLKLGRADEAATSFTRALASPTADPAVHAVSRFRLGWSLYTAGRHADAARAFEAFLTSHPSHPRKADALVWLGECHFKTGRYADAEIVYNQALVTTDDAALRQDAMYGLAWALARQQKYQEAERMYRTLTTEFKGGRHDMDANVRLGDALFAMRRFSEAARTWRYAVRMYPNHALAPYALLQLGNAEHRAGDTPAGIVTLKGLLEKYPASEYADKAQYSLGWLHFQTRDFEAAIAAFTTLITRWPASALQADAKYTIGDCLYNQGRYAEAEKAYRRVLDEHPDSPLTGDALDGIGQCLRMQKKDTEAASVKEEWLRTHPQSAVADAVALGNARKNYDDGDLDAAHAAVEAFLAAYPSSSRRAEALLLRARIEADRNERDKSLATLRDLIARHPGTPECIEAQMQLADDATAARAFGDAEAMYTALLAEPTTTSRRAEILHRRGVARRGDQRADEAMDDFLAARSADPDGMTGALASIELAGMAADRGNVDSALTVLAAIASARQDDAGAKSQYQTGRILARARRGEEAEKAFLRVEYVYPDAALWIARATLELGALYESRGDMSAARRAWQKLVDRFGGTPEAAEAATRLTGTK
jgi:TolA-binding protein